MSPDVSSYSLLSMSLRGDDSIGSKTIVQYSFIRITIEIALNDKNLGICCG
jgi:hypothetical protein